MTRYLILAGLVASLLLAGCNGQVGDYTAASSISKGGFARNGEELRALADQEVKLWGFVDHSNMYGDEGAKAILGDWWSGAGPDATTWRFNLKARAGDAAGKSFAVYVQNDEGRDELLRRFVEDASAGRPTRVFLTGRIVIFDAPTNNATLTGLTLELQSSDDVLLALPEVK